MVELQRNQPTFPLSQPWELFQRRMGNPALFKTVQGGLHGAGKKPSPVYNIGPIEQSTVVECINSIYLVNRYWPPTAVADSCLVHRPFFFLSTGKGDLSENSSVQVLLILAELLVTISCNKEIESKNAAQSRSSGGWRWLIRRPPLPILFTSITFPVLLLCC